MINLQLAVVFLADVVEIILIFIFILGYSFRKGKRYFVAAMVMVISCVLVILGLQDPSNRIFFTLSAHVLMAVVLFEGKITVVGELAFLVHYLISVVDSFCAGIILIFLEGQNIEPEINRFFDVAASSSGMIIILMLLMLVHRKRKMTREHLNQFNWRKFLYYSLYIIVTGIIIGYAEIAALDAGIVYRLRAVFVIGASLFGILIIASGIMIDVLLLQKTRLDALVRENARCIEEQTRQYILLNKKQMELRKFRHDYNAHMMALERLNAQEESDIEDGLIKTSKADTENHGIGLINVSDVVKRSNVSFKMKYENCAIITEILL